MLRQGRNVTVQRQRKEKRHRMVSFGEFRRWRNVTRRRQRKEKQDTAWCLLGNFAARENLLALRLANKLADLRAANANPRTFGAMFDEARRHQNEKTPPEWVVSFW